MRKLGIAIAVIVVLLFSAVLIVPHVVDLNSYHAQIQAQLQKKLDRRVSLGEMSLRVIPPSFDVSKAVIGEDPNFRSEEPFAKVERLSVSVKLLPLLHKEVEISSLVLDRPHVELIRNAQGEWNFATLGQKTEPAQKTPQKFELANLQISDGQLAITDYQKHQSRSIYDHIDLRVSDFAPNQQFSFEAAAHLPGQGKQEVSLRGKGGPIQQANLLDTNFEGTLRLNEVSISAAEKFLNSQALSGIDALVSGDAKFQDSSGKIATSGIIKLNNAQIRNVNLGYPITLDYDVADDLATDVIQVHRLDMKLGSTPITVAGTLGTRPTPAQLDLKLTATNASIAEAARLASAFGLAFNQGVDVNGRVDANIQAHGAANMPSMNGQISARDVVINGKELAQPVQVNNVTLALTPEAIRSNDFTATTGGTSVTANVAMAQYASANSVIDASLHAVNARIGEALNIAKAYGVSALEGISGDGLLSLDVHAQGPTKNLSAVNFTGTAKLQNATLRVPSLSKPIQIHNSDIRFSQNSAILENVLASIGQTHANGTLTLKSFASPQVQFTLDADKVNVAELQQLATPVAPKTGSVGPASNNFWRIISPANAQTQTNEPSMLAKVTGNGTVSVGTIEYDDLVMTNARSNVSLDRGIVRLNPVTADLYSGKEVGNITIDMRPTPPIYTVNLRTDKVDANKLISSVSSMKQMLYGLLNANVNASFSSNSATSIMQGMNGSLALNLVNGKLANLDLLHELATVGQFLGGSLGSTPKGFTNLLQLSGNFDVRNGVAQTDNLKAAIDGGTLAAKGLVNLANQSLNLRVTAVLNQAMSQAVGGTQIGGFMNTALANNRGELVMPVIVTGTLQHPQVTPDVQLLAQMKLQNLLPTSRNPEALTNGILGAIVGKNPSSNNQNASPNGSLSGILGALGGQKQHNQQQQNTSSGSGNADQQQQESNPFGDLLNQMLNKKDKQQQQKQPSPNPPKQ